MIPILTISQIRTRHYNEVILARFNSQANEYETLLDRLGD